MTTMEDDGAIFRQYSRSIREGIAAKQRLLKEALCDELSSGGDTCEDCRKPIPEGQPIYWFSDGGYEPRDGTYVCHACADKYVNNGGITP